MDVVFDILGISIVMILVGIGIPFILSYFDPDSDKGGYVEREERVTGINTIEYDVEDTLYVDCIPHGSQHIWPVEDYLISGSYPVEHQLTSGTVINPSQLQLSANVTTFCGYCTTKLDAHDVFCQGCGAPVSK